MDIVVPILSLLAGPGGVTVLVCLLLAAFLWGGWKITNLHIIPGVKNWLSKQDARFEKIMVSHEADRTIFKESIELLSGKIDHTDQKVDKLVDEVEDLKNAVQERRIHLEG